MATGRADEAVRPSQPFQVVEAVRISREPSPQLPKGLRVVDAGERSLHPSSICSSPVKWIPRTCLMTTPCGDHTRQFKHQTVVATHCPLTIRTSACSLTQ